MLYVGLWLLSTIFQFNNVVKTKVKTKYMYETMLYNNVPSRNCH